MKTALFTNFSNEEFIGYWDGKGRKFKPGQSLWMDEYLARHYAKHLVNRELLRVNENGSLVHKDGDKMTSPKFPEQVPAFMELFNKAFQLDEEDEVTEKKDAVDTRIETLNKNKETKKAGKSPENQNSKEPQTILSPDFDNEDDEAEVPKL